MSGVGEFRPLDDVELPRELDCSYVLDQIGSDTRVWICVEAGRIAGALKAQLTAGETGLDQMGPNVILDTIIVESGNVAQGGRPFPDRVFRALAASAGASTGNQSGSRNAKPRSN